MPQYYSGHKYYLDETSPEKYVTCLQGVTILIIL